GAFIQIHPKDARRRGIRNDDSVVVTSRRGAINAKAVLTRDVRRGCVWMPFHFSEARANDLTNDAGDAITGTAEYKVCAVEVKLEEVVVTA
ncbi:formate dehydrogenase subunit alpha, partial [Verrucomicrobia bacterium]|nr:formate dehydrogenase subunit alpha [Verrucomicrobiota bacterium]